MLRWLSKNFRKDLPSSQSGSTPKLNILIILAGCFIVLVVVDDNATSRSILQEMLGSFSCEVSLASSGEEGITELEAASKDKPFELVIMDWKMPGMDGIEASRRIKDHKGLSKIPPII